MNMKRKTLSFTATVIFSFFTPALTPPLYADTIFFSKTMDLSTGISERKILNLTNDPSLSSPDSWDYCITGSQAEQVMGGFLNRRTESCGYYSIILSYSYAGKGKNDALVDSAFGGILIFTLGLGALFDPPTGINRYQLTAVFTIFDANKNVIKSFTSSDYFEAKQYYGFDNAPDHDVTGKTAPISRRLLRDCQLEANEYADEINAALINARHPSRQSTQIIAQKAYTDLSWYLDRGSRIALIEVRAENPDEGNQYLNALTAAFVNPGQYIIVDRRNIDGVLRELEYVWTPYVDSATITQIGGHLGASILIFGSITGSGSNKKLFLQAISVATTQVIATTSQDL